MFADDREDPLDAQAVLNFEPADGALAFAELGATPADLQDARGLEFDGKANAGGFARRPIEGDEVTRSLLLVGSE